MKNREKTQMVLIKKVENSGDPLERQTIVSELRRSSGSQFDPDIVVYAIEMAEEGFVTEYELEEKNRKNGES